MLIQKLRERVPAWRSAPRSSAAFPARPKRDHQELLRFVRDMKFDALGVFEYSHEPGTPAGTMEEDPKLAVDAATKRRRKSEVMASSRKSPSRGLRRSPRSSTSRAPPRFRLSRRCPDRRRDAERGASKTSGVGSGGRLYQGRTYFQAPQIDAITYVQSASASAPANSSVA
jgi:hypothetical protein